MPHFHRREEAIRGDLGTFVVDLAADPFLDSIRDGPRYRELLRTVGLAAYRPDGTPR